MTGQLGMGLGEVVYDADLSACGRYRYMLSRTWDPLGQAVLFVGLNPSTADAEKDDPTIRKCMKFARALGYGGLVMCNLFAYRATDPRALYSAPSPDRVGPENDAHLSDQAEQAGLVIAAWGAHNLAAERARQVLPLLGLEIHCLGLTKERAPRHPLYVLDATRPMPLPGWPDSTS